MERTLNRARLIAALMAAIAVDAPRPKRWCDGENNGPRYNSGRKSKRPHFHKGHKFNRRHRAMRAA